MSGKISISKKAFFSSLSFIVGILTANTVILGILFVLFFFFILRDKLFLLFCLCVLLFGALYFQLALYYIPETPESPVRGMVVEEPSPAGNSDELLVEHKEGKTKVYTDRSSGYEYGDILLLDGEFEKPSPEGYVNYLRTKGVYHTSFFPEIEKKGESPPFFSEKLISLRKRARENIRGVLPVPESSFLEAMVLGEREAFSEDLNERLSLSGTRHITAISGMHIAIISTLLFYLLLMAGIKKEKAALSSLFFIILFIVFVGAPASAVRAGVMGGAVLISGISKRKPASFRLLSFAAAGMLFFNPLLLHFDLGFQLSFLAVSGILLLHKPLKRFFMRNTLLKKNERVTDLVAVTLGAQIFVFPLILYNFGYIPLLSVPANLLIVPILPLIVALGFGVALTGSLLFSFPAYLLLSFVDLTTEILASLPFSALHIENIPFSFIILIYLILFPVALALYNRTCTHY